MLHCLLAYVAVMSYSAVVNEVTGRSTLNTQIHRLDVTLIDRASHKSIRLVSVQFCLCWQLSA